DCTVKPRKSNAAYLQQQLQITQEEEVGIQSTQEEFDFMAAADAYEETKRLKVNCTLEDTLQQASTSGTQSDNAPVYDSDGSTEVPKDENCYDRDIFNMLTYEVQYTDLQTKLDRTKEKTKSCIIKKEKEYVVLWNYWCTKCKECKYDKISYDKAYNDVQQKIEWLQAQLGDLKGTSKDTPGVSEQNDTTKGTSMNTKFENQSTERKPSLQSLRNTFVVRQPNAFQSEWLNFSKPQVPQKVDKLSDLSNPVTSNSVPTTKESNVINNEKVIAPRIFQYVNGMKSRKKNQSANVLKSVNQKKHKANVNKSKKSGSKETLASPSKPRSFLRNTPLDRGEIPGMIEKMSKLRMGIMLTKAELALEQSQQGVSYEVSTSIEEYFVKEYQVKDQDPLSQACQRLELVLLVNFKDNMLSSDYCWYKDNYKKGLGFENYNAVLPPYTGNFMPPKPDLSFTRLDEFANKPVVENCDAKTSETKPKDGNPQMDLQDKRVIDSGCSRHMTWNMSYLTDYEEINGGYIAFGDDDEEADMNNMDITIKVNLISTTRIHKDHPLDQVIGDFHSTTQTRNMSKNLEEHRPFGVPDGCQNAFFYGKIEEEVYVCQPPGFEDPDFLDKLYKVEKALYGVHQAPRAWYETLSTYLLDNGFHRVKIDKTLFIKRHKGDILLVQVYVDDIVFGSTKKELCIAFEKMMHEKFQMSYMRELTFFLVLQVKQKQDGLLIIQDKYVTEILKKYGFTKVKNASTPIKTQKSLLKDEDGEEVDVHMYRSMIGSLMYLTSSRPDIMFAVCAYARYQVNLKVSHLHDVKRFFRCRLISWQCKKQTVVTNSTTEAEYVAASSCCRQVDVNAVEAERGVDCLPNDTIFKQLALIGKPRRKAIEVPHPSDPMEHVVDEVVYKELDDRLVRTATTASSLETEQDSGNINKTQSKATPNESSSQGTDSGSGTSCQDTMGDIIAQTRVLDLEKTKTDSLKKRVKKLEKKQRSRTDKLKRLYKRKIHDIDADEDITLVNDQDDEQIFDVNNLQGKEVFVQEDVADKEVNVAGEVNVASIATTDSATVIMIVDEVTLAQALLEIKTTKPKAKGIVLQEPSESRTTTIISSKKSHDKGKTIMIEEPMMLKKKDQIMLDEEVALKLQAKLQDEFDKEQRLASEKAQQEKEANITLIET
nr:hypothetical protein [Tanacetum cinerariifolium]